MGLVTGTIWKSFLIMKTTLSAVIIAKNEEERITACLSGVAFADEIIVVDNGSSDKTVELARSKGAKIVNAAGGDFSRVREAGLSQSKGKWILYVDADEIITDELRKEIRNVMNSKESHVYFIKRNTYYLGHHWPYKDAVERLFLRSSLKGWHGKLHETPVYTGTAGILTHALIHRTHRTIEEMLDKTNTWSETEAKLRLESHHPPVVWWRFIRVMCTGFFRSYIDQRGFRAGTVGWIESIYQAFSMFITYAKLWEMQQEQK